MEQTFLCGADFDAVSRRMVNMDPGDLVAVSELMDSVELLGKKSPVPELTAPLFAALDELIAGLLRKTGTENAAGVISDGIDLARTCFEFGGTMSDEETERKISEAVGGWLERIVPGAKAPESDRIGIDGPHSGMSASRVLESSRSAPKPSEPPAGGDGSKAALNESKAAEIIMLFFHETKERLQAAQNYVLELGKDNTGRLNDLFRIFHTIKGEAGFLNLPLINSLAHQIENVLDFLRTNRTEIDAETIDLLLEGVDRTSDALSAVEKGNPSEVENGITELTDRMYGKFHIARAPIGEILMKSGFIDGDQVRSILKKQREEKYAKKFGELGIEEHLISKENLEKALGAQTGGPGKPKPSHAGTKKQDGDDGRNAADQIVNVRASRIRYLIDMVGELTISLNKLDDSNRDVAAARKISRTLQSAAMMLGTVNIGSLFARMRRVAYESSRQLKREAELIISGEEIEVDRDLVESLGEPLMHLIRNSVGHGLESSEERLAAGKPSSGRICLRAERKGHRVVVSVEDDGRGLQTEKIRKRAVERGLISEEQAADATAREIWELIFQPGFSTTDGVNAISGRGVGMDVVRTYVNAQRGTLRLESEPGKYTKISMAFPINMAIIDGMIVRLDTLQFVIPIANIVETVKVTSDMFHSLRGGAEIVRIRGTALPVIDLTAFFGLPDHREPDRLIAVITEAHDHRYALLVDEVVAKREVVIKPLSPLFAGRKGIASGTLLQKGKIGLVLDVDEIVS